MATVSWSTASGPAAFPKNARRCALSLKEIAPSAGLRKWFGHEPERWPEFQKRYRRELRAKTNLALQIRQLEKEHQVVTLLFGARDEEHNQAVVLRDFLAARKLGKGA